MKDIILALIVRSLFLAHGLVAIWRAQSVWADFRLWLLMVPLGVLILEALFTIGARGGEEYKWISPCVLLYLCGVIPSIWFLELKNIDNRQSRHFCNDLHWAKPKEPGCKMQFFTSEVSMDQLILNVTERKIVCENEALFRSEFRKNVSDIDVTMPTYTTVGGPVEATTGIELEGVFGDAVDTLSQGKEALDSLFKNINIFDEQTWVLVLHQLLLFILIIGRWLLPTGEGISRDELSQLLLVFIGVGADILEFVTETIKELSVRCDRLIILLIMGFWSWSTLQFTLVLTASKARRTRAVGIYDEGEEENDDENNDDPVMLANEVKPRGFCHKILANTEVWGILSTLILQDGPFLGMRLYIMAGKGVVHQMIVFFTCKNLLVFALQIYRLSIIAHATHKDNDEDDEFDISALGALSSVMIGNKMAGIPALDDMEMGKGAKKSGGDKWGSSENKTATNDKKVEFVFESDAAANDTNENNNSNILPGIVQ